MIRYLVTCGLSLLIACQNNEPDPQLAEAFEAHQLALKTLDSLDQTLETLQSQPLSDEQQEELARIQEAHEQWESHLVEVPGYAHAEGHDHAHDHHHDHAMEEMMKDAPPSEILKIQQALLQEVQRLLDEARQLLAITQ